jgi:hypothetical protein
MNRRRVARWRTRRKDHERLSNLKPGPREPLHTLLPAERTAVLEMARREEYADLGHRILTVMAWDLEVCFLSFSSVYRIVRAGGELLQLMALACGGHGFLARLPCELHRFCRISGTPLHIEIVLVRHSPYDGRSLTPHLFGSGIEIHDGGQVKSIKKMSAGCCLQVFRSLSPPWAAVISHTSYSATVPNGWPMRIRMYSILEILFIA